MKKRVNSRRTRLSAQDTKTTLFKSCEYQLTKLTDDKERAYEYWYALTSGEVRSKVEQRGVMNVNGIYGELQTDYGQANFDLALYASRMSICALRTSLRRANAMCCWLMWVSASYRKL